MRNPERSGWQRSQVTSKICQRCVIDLSADSADRTTRQHLLALQAVIIPYKSTTWAAARQVRFTRRGAVGGAQPTEDDSWAQSAVKLPKYPCRRLVTADAMGMAKEGDRTGVDVDGSGNEIGDKDGDTPRCTQVQGSP